MVRKRFSEYLQFVLETGSKKVKLSSKEIVSDKVKMDLNALGSFVENRSEAILRALVVSPYRGS